MGNNTRERKLYSKRLQLCERYSYEKIKVPGGFICMQIQTLHNRDKDKDVATKVPTKEISDKANGVDAYSYQQKNILQQNGNFI